MSEYFWELILKDGDVIEITPQAVPVVQKRIGNKDPINLKTRTIPFSEIKDFRQTSKQFGQPLLEAAAQTFREPIDSAVETPYGYTEVVLEGKWVKKDVTGREYTNYYSKIPGYHQVSNGNGIVTVAFLQPIHDIDLNRVDYCNEDELARLTR